MARRRPALLAVGLVLAACSSSEPTAEPAPSSPSTTTTTEAADAAAWAAIDEALAGLGPQVGFLAAEVTDGSCAPVHAVTPEVARPTASQFKLFVLGALAGEVAAGPVAWDDDVVVHGADKSLGNAEGTGSLQFVADGTPVPVEEAATKMIAISDNTATDLLIDLVGRDVVEARAAEWMADATANVPFLTTRQMILLHYAEGLGDRYLATAPDDRAAFLATEVDPLPLEAAATGYTTEPRFVEAIEWFGSPADVCRALAGLQAQAGEPAGAALDGILSENDAGIGLAPEDWPTVWYKGGSEPGVLTMGWLATNADGATFVVQAMVTDPDAPLAEEAITELVGLAGDAFALLG
ncbi:MAG TPA: serine hydrolase [Iamia sp.]|nr:serine hydrolase [Iamia sp.]